MKIEASAAHQGSSKYQVEAAFKHGEKTIVHMEGPVTAMLSSKITHIQTELRVTCMDGTPHTVSTSVIFAPSKQVLAFEVKKSQARLLAIEWNMASQNKKETNIAFKLELPSLIEKSVSVIISEKLLHVTFNFAIMPKSSSPQRMKGFADIDYEGKKAQAEFAWDADRNPNKKLKVEANIVSGSSTLRNSVIK